MYGIKNKIHDITPLATKTTLNTKAADIEDEIPDITNLAKKTALNIKATGLKAK